MASCSASSNILHSYNTTKRGGGATHHGYNSAESYEETTIKYRQHLDKYTTAGDKVSSEPGCSKRDNLISLKYAVLSGEITPILSELDSADDFPF